MLEEPRSACSGHAHRTDKQLQRMDVAGAHVAHAAEIAFGAEPFRCLAGIHEGDMWIAVTLGQNIRMRPVSLYVTLLVCHGQLPGAIVDLDAMGCAEFEKMRFGFLRQIEKRLCAGEAEITL